MNKVLILDFGSQTTQLIARRVRELKVYCEIRPCNIDFSEVKAFCANGIILSGSPASAIAIDRPRLDTKVLQLGVPVLGICYGMQAIAQELGGSVGEASEREYGNITLRYKKSILFDGFEKNPIQVWMSHRDQVFSSPAGFETIAETDNTKIAAFQDLKRQIFGIQYHPEVTHTPEGRKVLENFLFKICKLSADWTIESFIERNLKEIKNKVGNKHVVCGLSGGVDSSVTAVLIHKAIGDQLTCVFVDNGLLRKNEAVKVEKTFREKFNINLVVVDARRRFLDNLAGVVDPEEKRKIIGREFINVFEETAKSKIVTSSGRPEFLAQGTLYPDVIESVSFRGPSATIKSHHNVGGLPEKMGLKLIEPLRELFKDEVREVGRKLGIPEEIVSRQPFPGPGLAVRILGEVTEERLNLLCEADDVMMQEIKNNGWYTKVWQGFCVLLPIKTVGVMGDERTYENVIAIRAVTSEDGMTADWVKFPYELLGKISNRIINEVKGVNRVVYDISSKPPATIEWE